MAKKKMGMCAYCGTMGEITRDHVIPKNLFAGNVPGDIPKVGVCPACNNAAKSDDDRYLQHMLVMDRASSKQPIPQQLFADKFARAVRGNMSQAANDVLCSRPALLKTVSGIIHDAVYVAPPEADTRSDAIMARIVRGLYQAYTGDVLPHSTAFDVFRLVAKPGFGGVIRVLIQDWGRGGCA